MLDTNVLLEDPDALFAFAEHDVVIPAVVIEELDAKKRYPDQIGANARKVARTLDALRAQGNLQEGVPTPGGGHLWIELNHRSMELIARYFASENLPDNRLLAVCLNLAEQEADTDKPRTVVVVSNDVIVRVKAESCGIPAEEYRSDHVTATQPYTGFTELELTGEVIDRFYRESSLSLDVLTDPPTLYPNQFAVLRNPLSPTQSAIARYNASLGVLRPLAHLDESIWGLRPRNAQQRMAIDLLLDPEIPLVTLSGRAGTGKTLLALATGLYLTQDRPLFHRLVVTRPIVPMGHDIGYLPGGKEEKLRPWLQPLYDNLEYLFQNRARLPLEDVLSGLPNVEIEALTYIRGRSLPDSFIIVDEAQNLTKHEMKTVVSRVGENSKIVLLGDTEQIDHPYLDTLNNGLTHLIETMKDQPLAGHVKLIKGERSALAQLAADLL